MFPPFYLNSQVNVLSKYYSVDQLIYTKSEDISKYYEIIDVVPYY